MRRICKRLLGIILCLTLVTGSLLGVVGNAATTGVYELTFENLFIFEQWANHPDLKLFGDASANSTLTTDVSSGSFVIVNNSASEEAFTTYSADYAGNFYYIPVKGNTDYTFSYVANGTTTSFETFVFFYDASGTFKSIKNNYATNYGQNKWSFTTPKDVAYIQVRFDNNTPKSDVTVSNIVIREKSAEEYAQSISHRKTFTYSEGTTYGALPTPEKEGKVFAGWYTGPDGTGERITSDTLASPSSKVLYAKWDPIISGDIRITSLPVKQDYLIGERLDTRGLVIGVTYPNGVSENIDEGFAVSPQVLTSTGTQTITISYGGSSAQFTVNVKDSHQRNVYINSVNTPVAFADNTYTLNYSGSAFNRYEIRYSSDAYVKAEMNLGGVTEEFFLEPNESGTFSGFIDGFINGTTRTAVTSIKFTPLDKASMSFAMTDITLSNAPNPADSNGMVYLDGANHKIGIDLDWGGALTYLEDKTNSVMSSVRKYGTKTTEVDFKSNVSTSSLIYNTSSNVNLINAHDTGRLVQQSYYGTGSYPYEPGMYGEAVWNYNPVQGGNLYNEASKIVDLKITENEIYIKCRPLDWAKGAQYITPSYMEAWYTLENGMMRATCRFVDFSGYPAVTSTQELPAFYCVEPLNDFVYFSGGDAWSDNNTQVTRTDLKFWGDTKEQNFTCNENWAAFRSDESDGLAIGLYCPGQTNFCSGIYNGSNGSTHCSTTDPATEDPTSYIGVVDTLYFQSYSPISYCYYISTGTIDNIRSSFKSLAQTDKDICNATQTNGFCDMCGKYVQPQLSTDKYDVNGDGKKDAVYEISNTGELVWFRNHVNSGNTSANAVLVNDIIVNKNLLSDTADVIGAIEHVWTPIGTSNAMYNGTFNGQGHTIRGLYCMQGTDYAGLFGYVGSAGSVREVGVTDSYISSANYSGGIVGRNAGKITNCFVTRSFIHATTKSGGIVGENTSTIFSCYSTAFVYGETYVGAICGNNTATISSCYYLEDNALTTIFTIQNGIGTSSASGNMSDTDGATIVKTAEEFYSGEVAYLLQKANSSQVWGQLTNSPNSAPIFDYTGQYKVIAVTGADCYSVCFVGDIVSDGKIDIQDYQSQVNMALSHEVPDSNLSHMLRADLNADGYIDALDCSLLALMRNGLRDGISIYPTGDFDCDGIAFTDEDMAGIKKGLINQNTLSARQKYSCDLNADGVLDITDRDILSLREEIRPTSITLDLSRYYKMKQTTANVIIISGQSNAYGISPYTSQVINTVSDVDFSNINIKYNNIASNDGVSGWRTHYSNSSFEPFRPGIGGQADSWFGPELGIAYYLATNEATKDETWYIIKYTGSGTALAGNWIYDQSYVMADNSSIFQNDMGGYLSDLMIPYINSALDEIAGIHGENNINIRSFMWHQGESDSVTEQMASQYAHFESALVNKVRTSFIGRDNDAHIGFVNAGIAAYNEAYNIWPYADIVNTAKANAAMLWYIPANTPSNVINKTTAGLYANPSGTIADSIWIDTSTCISKLQNINENGENDGYHYCGTSMLQMGIWYAQSMLQVAGF